MLPSVAAANFYACILFSIKEDPRPKISCGRPRSQKLQLPCPLTPVRAWGTNCTAGLASSSAPPRQGLGSRHACPECLSQPICSPAVFLWVWGLYTSRIGMRCASFTVRIACMVVPSCMQRGVPAHVSYRQQDATSSAAQSTTHCVGRGRTDVCLTCKAGCEY